MRGGRRVALRRSGRASRSESIEQAITQLTRLAGGRQVPQWQRSLKFRSASRSDWQWVKAFLHLCRRRQRAFLLSSNRHDCVYVSTSPTGIRVQSGDNPQSGPIAGAGDYESWWIVSPAHRRLALTLSDRTITYITVTAVDNNADGTFALTTEIPVIGRVIKVSLAEQVRFDRDEISPRRS